KLAFDVNLAALAQIAFGHADQTIGLEHDAVPLGALLALPGLLVFPVFRSGNPQVGDAATVLEALHLRVLAEIADQDYLVDAACHENPLEGSMTRSDGEPISESPKM